MSIRSDYIPSQLYQRKKTVIDYPSIQKLQDDFMRYSVLRGFIRTDGKSIKCKGRTFDDATILYNIDFSNKVVCEIGARDSILMPYITKTASEVYVSDYFEEWGKGTINDLGDYNHWAKIWSNAAIVKDKLHIHTENILKTSYDNDKFDVLIAKSVINHTYNQNTDGDILAMREIYRIVKSGGIVAMSVILGQCDTWKSGTYIYTLSSLKSRLLEGFEIIGEINDNFDDKYNDDIYELAGIYPVSDAIFFLRKV